MIAPGSEEELAALVREGRSLHATGGGTKRHHGPAPAPGTEEVSLKNLAGIVAYEPGDLVVTVRMGTRLADLQADLAKQGQWLPLDPPYANATVGGILATNSSGPRRLGYGTMRDHLLGARVVGGDGTSTRSGGRVVKNVTGFDLHKLHVGAFGTLGIVVEASFKVRPLPEMSVAFVFRCGSLAEAHALLLKVHASPLQPVALEALERPDPVAIVGVEGSRAFVDRHRRNLPGYEEVEGGPVWSELRDLPERFKDRVVVRIGAKPHDLPKLLPEKNVWIRAGSGVARVILDPGAPLPEPGEGGYAVVESAPLDLPGRDRLPWGVAPNPLMEAIRKMRDPKGILNPGRIAV